MSKKERERKQRQWHKEKAEIDDRRRIAPQLKAALRAKGCVLPFYDILDSYESEFKKLVAWAKGEFQSLHDVFEVSRAELGDDGPCGLLDLPADWEPIRFHCDDELAASYAARDTKANLRGATAGFRDGTGAFHTIIQVVRNPVCQWEHKEYKYALKLPVLLHEIGHVKDYENKINFDRDSKIANLIEGEVYAHLFALDECFRRAYFMSGNMYLESLAAYKEASDCRGEVVRRLLARFQQPVFRQWFDYDV